MASLEARLDAASTEYQQLQTGSLLQEACSICEPDRSNLSVLLLSSTDLTNAVEARQKLDAQLTENEEVYKVPSITYIDGLMR